MANQAYLPALTKFGSGGIIWPGTTHDIRTVLVDLNDYAFSQAHEFLASIPAAGRIATQPLTGRTVVDGAFDANDVTFPGVSGDPFEAVVIYRHVTGDADSPLILFIDTATGLPTTPDGRPIEIRWSDGASKIFRFRSP